MKLTEFLDQVQDPSFLQDTVVLHFKAKKEYPLLFFSFVMKKFKDILSFDVETINLERQEKTAIKAKLSTTFLGQKKLYWLEDISALKSKDRQLWSAYLKNYTGPNVAAFFSNESLKVKPAGKTITVQIDDFVDQKMLVKLVGICAKPISKSFLKVILSLFDMHKNLTLDLVCMLMNYGFLVGRKYKEFSDTWVHKIISPQKSLFTLSQYFFDKNPKMFFKLWLAIKEDFPETFWVVFWSEQVWRACNVVKYMQNRQMADARKISYRLPFAFMQRSWRKFTPDELVNAHNFLYSVDFSLKNGGASFSLDLFYSKFLHSQFAQK